MGAEEPFFSQSIHQLEQASGRPAADIRLSTELQQVARQKIAELGLDPQDTTGPELYQALHERLKHDDLQVRATLEITGDASATDILARIEMLLTQAEMPKKCFAMRAAVAKRLFKSKIPKQAMKRLGYRSIDSMLKHEPVAQVFAAAMIAESDSWRKAFYAQYERLSPSDFESRAISITMPNSPKWAELAASYASQANHSMILFKEIGSLVLLPMEAKTEGLTTAVLLMALHAMNDIRSYSSFIKLQQVKPTFGSIVSQAVASEPTVAAKLAGQQVTWKTIHRYFARYRAAQHPEIFEPHVQSDDLTWAQAEDVLSKLQPSLSFWRGTQNVVLLDGDHPVSFNMLDVALNYYNELPFQDRVVHFVRDTLWHDLMLRYLKQRNLEEAVGRQLSYELVDDLALAE